MADDPTSPRHARTRSKLGERPWLNIALGVLCIAAAVVAYTTVGQASPSSAQTTRTATARRGVVQTTVSGSGNIQSADQLNLGFKTSGTVTHIYVKAGQQVAEGQLLATLDPQTAEVTLEQAKATLQSAEANLAKEEETEGESTTGQGSATANAATATTESTSTVAYAAIATTASTSSRSKTTSPTSGSKSGGSSGQTRTTESSAPSQSGEAHGASSSTKQSAATREANLASARAAVKSDKLTVQSDEQAVQNTKLYAPHDGTIISLSGEVGETVSGTGTTKASSSASSSSSSSSAAGGAGAKSGAGGGSSTGAGSSGSSESSSGSASFAVLSDLQSLQLVVALSESEVGDVHAGQIATVTIEALNGRKLAAHVVSVSEQPTSSSGAVSYDVTFQLDQRAEGLKIGMSATAEVVVKQAEGLNVPTSAIKGGSVTVERKGRSVTQAVTTGLAGDSTTIILSGLNAGEVVVLPITATSNRSGSGSSLGARLGSRSGRGGFGGGLGGGGLGGGVVAFPAGGPPGG